MLCQINRAGYESLACVCRHETQHCILVFAPSGAFIQYARKVLVLLELSVQTIVPSSCLKITLISMHVSMPNAKCACTCNGPLCDYTWFRQSCDVRGLIRFDSAACCTSRSAYWSCRGESVGCLKRNAKPLDIMNEPQCCLARVLLRLVWRRWRRRRMLGEHIPCFIDAI